ncbi:hypothetical protein GCM10011521_13960 [Arenimonas soli]|uniref:RDD domain-containing protein n=1 Tax=Arenimonas soli TaxID=2269504 RepID=A0ABQ1HHZ0_9GAMM|nr:hypothetical protein [Arenimonas soli]GGA76886.1 hypothetical protein GCM10011521_13960 [Arenimonas soli]
MSTPESDPGTRLTLPRRTTPTWEVELLLSGATVFALVQLATWLPGWASHVSPRLSDFWRQVADVSLVYLMCGVVVLTVAFVLHLLLRAYWVALVGMDSVFPGGLKTEKMRDGPVIRDWTMARWKPMPVQIEQADNQATIVFGLGIGLARMMVTITVLGSLLMLGVLVVAAITGTAEHAGRWVSGTLLLLLVPWLLVMGVDRRFGDRLPRGHWLRRGMEAVLAVYSWAGVGRESSTLVTLYTTSVGDRRGNWIVGGLIAAATLASITAVAVLKDDLGWGQYGRFPLLEANQANSVRHVHYANQHEPAQSPRLPYIPDLQAQGGYLPLVVPFVPQLHQQMLDACPEPMDLPPGFAGRQQRSQATLACIAEGFAVTLDGQPLAQAPELYSDATRDLRGLVYMIPLAGQSRGRHELVVALQPQPESKPGNDDSPPIWRIPYWY